MEGYLLGIPPAVPVALSAFSKTCRIHPHTLSCTLTLSQDSLDLLAEIRLHVLDLLFVVLFLCQQTPHVGICRLDEAVENVGVFPTALAASQPGQQRIGALHESLVT